AGGERARGAVRVSEYPGRQSREQCEAAHADGRARFAGSARRLFAKVPEGVYRELLLERLAEVVGLAPARLDELWASGRGPTPAGQAAPRTAGARAASHSATGAGRGSLVRQALARDRRYPAPARDGGRG